MWSRIYDQNEEKTHESNSNRLMHASTT